MTALELKNFIRATLVVRRTKEQEYTVFDTLIDFFTAVFTNGIPAWTTLLTFNTDGTGAGSFCTATDVNSHLRFWKTKIDGNINHQPPTDPLVTEDTYWIEVSPSDGSSIKEWAAGIYQSGLQIVYFDISGSGKDPALYLLANPTRPFTSSNFSAELTAGDWIKFGSTDYETASTAAADIHLDMLHRQQSAFKMSADIAAAKTWHFDNTENARELTFRFKLTAAYAQTFPAAVKMSDASWNSGTKIWLPDLIGEYEATALSDGTTWYLKIFGPFT